MRGLFFSLALLSLALLPAAAQAQTRFLWLGDSLTAGFGVDPAQAYPALVEKALQAQGYQVAFTNASISGSTTASALGRLRWYQKSRPQVLFLALGANDGLRGQPVEGIKANLAATIELAQSHQIQVILAGMRMPPNYGAAYTQEFEAVFPELARRYRLPLLPFLLEGVAGRPGLNQADGIHPNAEGYQRVAALVTEFLTSHLKK